MSDDRTPESTEAPIDPPATPLAEQPAAARSPESPPSPRVTLRTLILALLVLPFLLSALCMALFVGFRLRAQNFKIEGTAMEPTVLDGQRLIVDTWAYRGSYGPRRGDIVVFESWTSGVDFIKRVIGTPGETIEIRDGAVWIDGERLEEPYLVQTTPGSGEAVVLGADEYYVLGDNRFNSSDSRDRGPVHRARIIGRLWFIYWPPRDFGAVPERPPQPPDASAPYPYPSP